jgi:hypothetical protein
MTVPGRAARFAIDANSVVGYREQLKAMAQGVPPAEAAIDGFSDWQVVEAMERMWAVAAMDDEGASSESGAAATTP